MSAGFSALSRALLALAWTIPESRFITLMVLVPFWCPARKVRAAMTLPSGVGLWPGTGPVPVAEGASSVRAMRSPGKQCAAAVTDEFFAPRCPVVGGEEA